MNIIKTILKHQKLIIGVALAAVSVAAYEAFQKQKTKVSVATVSSAASGLKGFASGDVLDALSNADLSSYDGLQVGSGATGIIPRTLANVNNGLGYDAIPLASYGFLSNTTLH